MKQNQGYSFKLLGLLVANVFMTIDAQAGRTEWSAYISPFESVQRASPNADEYRGTRRVNFQVETSTPKLLSAKSHIDPPNVDPCFPDHAKAYCTREFTFDLGTIYYQVYNPEGTKISASQFSFLMQADLGHEDINHCNTDLAETGIMALRALPNNILYTNVTGNIFDLYIHPLLGAQIKWKKTADGIEWTIIKDVFIPELYGKGSGMYSVSMPGIDDNESHYSMGLLFQSQSDFDKAHSSVEEDEYEKWLH